MRHLKDFAVIFLVCSTVRLSKLFVSGYVSWSEVAASDLKSMIALSILFSFFLSVVLWLGFVYMVRVNKSYIQFSTASWALLLGYFLFILNSTSNSALTDKWHGLYLFYRGDVTIWGVIYLLSNPLTVIALFATFKSYTQKVPKLEVEDMEGERYGV